MRLRFISLFAIVSITLGAARFASAQESVSARPTVFFGGDPVYSGGFSTELNLGVSARTPDLVPGFHIEAELSLNVAEILAVNENEDISELALQDNSSFVALVWNPISWPAGDAISFTVLPLHSDRIYLGYDFPLANQLTISDTDEVAGADLRINLQRGYAFASVKSSVVENEKISEPQREYTVLVGGGFDIVPMLRIEAEGAHAALGVNPEPEVLGETVETWAAAGRIVLHRGIPVGPPVDYQRYVNDPAKWEKLMAPESYDGAFSGAVWGEALFLSQQGLADPDVFGAVEAQSATGYAIEGRAKWGFTRAFLRAQFQSASMLESPGPGFPPYYAFAATEAASPELMLSAAVDHKFDRLGFTPGLALDVRRPASITLPTAMNLGSNNPQVPVGSTTTIVLENQTAIDVLPSGGEPSVEFEARATLRWDSAHFSAIAEGFLTANPNRVSFDHNALGEDVPDFSNPDTLGFDVLLQARF